MSENPMLHLSPKGQTVRQKVKEMAEQYKFFFKKKGGGLVS